MKHCSVLQSRFDVKYTFTQWTWVWANSGRWWRTRKAGMLQSMGSQRDTTEQLNNKILLPPIIWLVCLCLKWKYFYNFIYPHSIRLLRFILDVMCSLTHPFKFLATVHCIYMLNVFIHSPVNRCVFSVCHYQKLRQQNHSSVCIPEYT